jgi:Ca2+-binding RTX toxin-like protein
MATRIQRIWMVAAVVAVSTLALASMASAKVVVANAGENYLIGTPQKDEISGLAEDDFIVGRGDADDLSGGRGEDKLEGRRGGDYIVGGRGVDVLYGHGGNDRIEAADGEDEFVSGGRGDHDHASVDGGLGDRVKNCEFVNGQRMNY